MHTPRYRTRTQRARYTLNATMAAAVPVTPVRAPVVVQPQSASWWPLMTS